MISDLDEGGNHAGLLHRLQEIQESGVTVVCLLAIQDGGKPYYNKDMAQKSRKSRDSLFCLCTFKTS